jgi:hypothetical protein
MPVVLFSVCYVFYYSLLLMNDLEISEEDVGFCIFEIGIDVGTTYASP